jgi:hypothetical protein
MKRLTNLQMQVLSKEVTNQLKKAHQEKTADITRSDEYINFDTVYTDDIIETLRTALTTMRQKKAVIDGIDKEIDIIGDEIEEFVKKRGDTPELKKVLSAYSYNAPHRLDNILNNYTEYKKNQVFKETVFNEEEMLNTVQANILLSEIGDPKELVYNLVEKFKNG